MSFCSPSSLRTQPVTAPPFGDGIPGGVSRDLPLHPREEGDRPSQLPKTGGFLGRGTLSVKTRTVPVCPRQEGRQDAEARLLPPRQGHTSDFLLPTCLIPSLPLTITLPREEPAGRGSMRPTPSWPGCQGSSSEGEGQRSGSEYPYYRWGD